MRNPPRLIVWTLTVTFITVAVILSVVLIVLTLDARDRVRAAETEKLQVSERMFAATESRRQQEQLAAMSMLAENPTLKAALDTYFTESRFDGIGGEQDAALRATVVRETEKLAAMTGADVLGVIDTGGRLFARAGPARDRWPQGDALQMAGTGQPAFELLLASGRDAGSLRTLNGEEYAVGTLFSSGPARIYTLTSIDAAARTATREAMTALGTVALGGFALAALGSLWLARTLTTPIHRVAGAIATMTATRDLNRTLQPTGAGRELDELASAFNALMQGLRAAETDTRAAYLGAIRALAAALDARDPYTAGHSERVSALSVLVARHMRLPDADIDVVRLGALLHDIGKIGLTDEILRKPGALTAEEFEQIKRHPALGARILRQVPFLAPHLPIVELHHERPDGKGYPFGLRGEDIPVAARIVHVADAFDAMTSARAYRPALGRAVAFAELQRYSGTQFDPATVEALCAALPASESLYEPALQALLGRGA